MLYTHEKTSNTIEDKNTSPGLNSIVVLNTKHQDETLKSTVCDNQYKHFSPVNQNETCIETLRHIPKIIGTNKHIVTPLVSRTLQHTLCSTYLKKIYIFFY